MDDGNEPAEAPEATWPGVYRAYDFVGPSYAWILQRLDAADSRLQTLQTFAASITLAAPILAASLIKDVDFQSPWFASGLCVFAVLVVVGAGTRGWGSVILMSPKVLYEHWLHFSEWEFKKNAVHFAAEHFEANRSLVNKRGWVANGMTGLLLLEIVLLSVWVAIQV